ncbi:hypothetical protein S7711_04777 [Stachybotrys chartarum IBT 7711]|uniref:Uncharacterized protein n=1 Tax=Stachybotrys chartarum (strain CBS 109288 / IBT 7711) TaxID=1280523 RepID=A0A084ASG7_STACB|nr:hypothetical protein S7711_04777 [Stachybotrys chartarum IBT 7711]
MQLSNKEVVDTAQPRIQNLAPSPRHPWHRHTVGARCEVRELESQGFRDATPSAPCCSMSTCAGDAESGNGAATNLPHQPVKRGSRASYCSLWKDLLGGKLDEEKLWRTFVKGRHTHGTLFPSLVRESETMSQDSGEMDRIREDLIRRARMERNRYVQENPSELPSQVQLTQSPAVQDVRREQRWSFFGGFSALPRLLVHRTRSPRAQTNDEADIESPKTPDFRLATPNLPSARLHLPILSSTRTPRPSRPASLTSQREPPLPASPLSASTPPPPSPERPNNPAFNRFFGFERFPKRWRHGAHRERRSETDGGERGPSQTGGVRRKPKRFLFCFPWVKSRRARSHMLQCFVSGMFLGLLLAVYLGLAVSRRIQNGELTILLIMIILFATVFFCYSLLRLCMIVVRGDRGQNSISELRRTRGSGGFAVPAEPIPVVLARDEEAAGIESEANKFTPPAYGLWRESVRVDPNRIFWQRNEAAAPMATVPETGPRPPSYMSDDGVTYMMEAVPRSTVPTTDVPLPVHPSEQGRVVHASDVR